MKSLCSIFYHGNSNRTLKLLVIFLFALRQLRKYCSHFFIVISFVVSSAKQKKMYSNSSKSFPKLNGNNYILGMRTTLIEISYFLVIVLKLKNVIILVYTQNQSLQSLLRDFLIGKWPLNISNIGKYCLLR